jgi:flagellar biosynthesis protein FlhB
MDSNQLHAWSRHYDSLLWNVTTLFAAAIGGLLVYTYSTFHIGVAIVGLIITCLPVYFAASFREASYKINQHLPAEERKIIFEDRKLKQWSPYVLVFVLLETLWVWLLLANMLAYWWLWLLLGISAIVYTLYWSRLGRIEKANA